MRLKVGHFLKLVAIANRLGIAAKPYLWLVKGLTRFIPPSVCARWIVKLVVGLFVELSTRSSVDADARFAREVLMTIHGDSFPLYMDRITEQMCREPDEEHPFEDNSTAFKTSAMVYTFPSGCRMWFTVWGGDTVVGSGILKPEEADDEMFWNRLKPSDTDASAVRPQHDAETT